MAPTMVRIYYIMWSSADAASSRYLLDLNPEGKSPGGRFKETIQDRYKWNDLGMARKLLELSEAEIRRRRFYTYYNCVLYYILCIVVIYSLIITYIKTWFLFFNYLCLTQILIIYIKKYLYLNELHF